jgi:hypothetical protein
MRPAAATLHNARMAFPAAPGGATDQRLRLSGLARAVIAEAAPAELELFDDVTAAWERGDLAGTAGARDGGHGGIVGLGLTSPVLVDVVYPLLTGTIAQILGAAAAGPLRRLGRHLRWGRRRRPDPVVPAELFARAEQAREICLAQALAAGVPKRKAELIAKALYAALVRAALPPPG